MGPAPLLRLLLPLARDPDLHGERLDRPQRIDLTVRRYGRFAAEAREQWTWAARWAEPVEHWGWALKGPEVGLLFSMLVKECLQLLNRIHYVGRSEF